MCFSAKMDMSRSCDLKVIKEEVGGKAAQVFNTKYAAIHMQLLLKFSVCKQIFPKGEHTWSGRAVG